MTAYDEAFFLRFPLLYSQALVRPATCPLGLYGVECGPGWKAILELLSEKLERMIEAIPESERRHSYASQVKEKFGELRFYMACATDEMRDAIADAMKECLVTCETCGKPGSLQYNEVACEEHRR